MSEESSSELSDSSSPSSSSHMETVEVEIHEPPPPQSAPAAPPAPAPAAPPAAPSARRAHRKRKRSRSRGRSGKRQKQLEDTLHYLAQQVSGIQNYIASSSVAFQPTCHSSVYVPEQESVENVSDISADVSGELYAREKCTEESVQSCELPVNLNFSLNTILKEPTIQKSSDARVQLINSMQHFGTEDWNNVRYAEVQKQYCSFPGFTYLESNDEIKPYDKYSSLALIERGFAAITQALIMQNEAAQSAFTTLIEWANSSGNITAKLLQEKVNELFIKGNFQKISSDVLQLACGHRAELVQQRRDGILRSVKDNFLKSSLRKIPPTCENLFNKESFSSAIEKAGGVSKTFWPVRAPSTQTKAAAQAQPQQQAQVMPSHASNYTIRMPGTVNYNYPHFDYVNRPPFQGAWNTFTNSQGRDYPRPTFRSNNQQVRPFRQRSGPQNFQGHDMYSNTIRPNKTSAQTGPRRLSKRKY